MEITGRFSMHIGQHPLLVVEDGIHKSRNCKWKCVCELARKNTLYLYRIQTQLRKTNDTPFIFKDITLDTDIQGIFPISELKSNAKRCFKQAGRTS